MAHPLKIIRKAIPETILTLIVSIVSGIAFEKYLHAGTDIKKRYLKIKPSKKITLDKNTIVHLWQNHCNKQTKNKDNKYGGAMQFVLFYPTTQICNIYKRTDLQEGIIYKNIYEPVRKIVEK